MFWSRTLTTAITNARLGLAGISRRGMAKEAAAAAAAPNSKNKRSNRVPAPESTTYSALEARLNLEFKTPSLMEQVCTHKSYEHGRLPSNERLEWLGKRVLNLFVGEHILAKYPNLPMEAVQDVQHANFGMASLAEIGKQFGMAPCVRWESVSKDSPSVGLTKVVGKAVQALVGAVYQEQGMLAAKMFVQKHMLAKPINVESVMQIKNPKLMLVALTKSKGMEYPVARIMKETGRFTSSPVFVVGVFCGTRMVGMGFGSSLKMAEHRAAKDALLKHYMKEIKEIQVPSEIDQEKDISFFPPASDAIESEDSK